MKKNNVSCFWDFYKWQIMAALVVAVLGIYLLWHALTQKECVLSVMLLDCHSDVSEEQMEEELLQALQLDKTKYTVSVQSSLMLTDTGSGSYAMTSLSRLLADIGSEKLDVCGMLEKDFLEYEEAGTFMDLRICMGEGELGIFGDALLKTEDGRVVGIYADALPGMRKSGCYDTAAGRGVIGIVYNTKHAEKAGEYLMYLVGAGL